MADRPILFSSAMVRALLSGKSQTRRVFKPQPTMHEAGDCSINGHRGPVDYPMREIAPRFWTHFAVGDRLWVRETFRGAAGYDSLPPAKWGNKPIWYEADGQPGGDWWFLSKRARPGIHMPRWASRLTLTVTEVRVQRLQDISEEDAIAEGVEKEFYTGPDPQFFGSFGWRAYDVYPDGSEHRWNVAPYRTAVRSYQSLWDRINEARGFGWAINPWVTAVSFDVEKGNIGGVS